MGKPRDPDLVFKPGEKIRHEAGDMPKLEDLVLFGIFLVTAFMTTLSLFAMGVESGPLANLKYLIVGIGAAGAGFIVNKTALERLAPMHAIGFNLAGAVAIVGIVAVGAGTFAGSLVGLTYKGVTELFLQEAAQEQTEFVTASNERAVIAEQLTPTMGTVATDIGQTKFCEIRRSCLSENGGGGYGPMSRALEAQETKSQAIADALNEGKELRSDLLDDLNDLNAEFLAVLADESRPLKARRVELQELHAQIRQVVDALDEAAPIALVVAYEEELRSGVKLSGNTASTHKLNAYLGSHADTLAEQLKKLPDEALVAPEFPAKPGMIDVIGYIPHYFAIALLVFVAELIVPLSLYLMTFIRLRWQVEVEEDRRDKSAETDEASS